MVYLETFYFPSVEEEEEELQRFFYSEEHRRPIEPALNYIAEKVYPFSLLAHRLLLLQHIRLFCFLSPMQKYTILIPVL